MLLTEDEAKTKGCPYKPMAYTTPGNAGEPVPQWTIFDTCSGSECMAWRWDDEEFVVCNGERIRRGFCGLAGRVKE